MSVVAVSVWLCVVAAMAAASASPTESPANNFPLDLEELAKLGIDTDKLLDYLKRLAEGNYMCGVRDVPGMQRHFLRNSTPTCNDGSPAGYYIRKSYGSTRWLLFLEGGWYCFDQNTCHSRWRNTPHLMSSKHWPEWRKGTGILSWNPEENPFVYNANLVYIPYCSSDTWSGSFKARNKDEFSFMGALIIQEVVKDLVALHGLGQSKKLYLAGSSAGGTGVLLNLDRVASLLGRLAPRIEVRGIADSGWFLDNKQYQPIRCTAPHTCAPTDGIPRGIRLWRGLVPESCKATYPPQEQWRCYFGYRIYPTLKAPVFVVQHLFDEAQITVDNVGPPVKKEQWQYIHNMGKDLRRTLLNVSAVFAPACLSHIVLTRSEWHRMTINGVTLAAALQCWEEGSHEQNLYERQPGRLAFGRLAQDLLTRADRPLSDDPKSGRKKRRHRKVQRERKRRRRRRRKRKRRRKNNKGKKRLKKKKKSPGRRKKNNRFLPTSPTLSPTRNRVTTIRQGADGGSPPVRERRSLLLFDAHDVHHMQYHDNLCSHHHLDHCAWPQCNLSCPKIRNPFTGEEMDFIDLLLQFGLDLTSIANALGMDLPTLQTMDHDMLLKLMVQQSR